MHRFLIHKTGTDGNETFLENFRQRYERIFKPLKDFSEINFG